MVKIITPFGTELPRDPELQGRIQRLPKDAKLSDVFKVVSEWEQHALEEFRQMEKTKKSGKLSLNTSLRRV